MPINDKPLEKCCNSCPFLKANADRPNPEGWVADDQNKYDWYTQKNLDRLWKDGLSEGDPMVCHSHDDNAAEYGGNSAKEGTKKVCLGAIIQQYKHIKIYETCMDGGKVSPAKAMQAYKAQVGKAAMTRRGLQEAAWMFVLGRTGLLGGAAIPREISERRAMRNITGFKLDINKIVFTHDEL